MQGRGMRVDRERISPLKDKGGNLDMEPEKVDDVLSDDVLSKEPNPNMIVRLWWRGN